MPNLPIHTAGDTAETPRIAAIVQPLKASADTLRLQILQLLQHDSYGVLELCTLLKTKQSAMSHHLKVLASAELVTTRREGNAIFYRRALPTGDRGWLEALFAALDATPLCATLQAAVDRAGRLRSERSRQFFSANVDRFKAQQDLISPIDDYREAVNEILDALFAAPDTERDRENKQAIEIGPGDGSYLADLAQRFDHVIALDNADAMLQRCRDTATQQALGNIGFVLGDTAVLRQLDAEITGGSNAARRANCVVANMVLHHNASPQTIFANIAPLLADRGAFVVAELCQHDQHWVREAAGDVWLGFNEGQLDHWAAQAGLEKGPSSYTALKNGFRIQIHSYINNYSQSGEKPLPTESQTLAK